MNKNVLPKIGIWLHTEPMKSLYGHESKMVVLELPPFGIFNVPGQHIS
jgi:hypothetical protein